VVSCFGQKDRFPTKELLKEGKIENIVSGEYLRKFICKSLDMSMFLEIFGVS